MNQMLFPFADYWWLYLAFTGFVGGLLAFDLACHRQDRAISMRAAAAWTAIWMALALAFSLALFLFVSAKISPGMGRQVTLEFLAGYVVEESLSIDNMFVFALIFRYFAVPSRFQHRVLFYGVLGAMIFRAIFVAVGATLIQFDWVMILFGVFLVFTGIRMATEKEKPIDPGNSLVIRSVCRFFPVTRELHGSRFFVYTNGIRQVTPLLIVLLFLETTDIMFAVDSVPAVFGVTKEPFIVYTSNVFAVLGLRAMFFLLSGALDRFHLLKHGLAVVLVFVGLKMIWLDHLFGGRFPIGISLAVISVVIGASIVLSFLFPKSVTESAGGQNRPRGAKGAPWDGEACSRALKAFRSKKVLKRAAGGICVLLAAADVLYATGLGGGALPLPGVDQAGAWPLYWSAAGYAVCGAVLLAGAGTGERSGSARNSRTPHQSVMAMARQLLHRCRKAASA